MEAIEGNVFLLGAKVRFTDGVVGRLEGLDVATEPWKLVALLVRRGLLLRRTLRVTADAVGSAAPGGIGLRVASDAAEKLARRYHPAEGRQVLGGKTLFQVAEGPVQRLGLELAGLMTQGAAGEVINFVGITLIRRERVLMPAAKALWQRRELIWVDLGAQAVAKAGTQTGAAVPASRKA